jgi:hemerythrin superfamily protein
MATARATAPSRGSANAIEMLTSDHREVEGLFEQYESSKGRMDEDQKFELAQQICEALAMHATIEEEIFYPAVRAKTEEELGETLDEAEVEHDAVKFLIEQIEESEESDGSFDAKVKVLSEYVKHHVKEEEGEMFPKVKSDAILDLDFLGAEMAKRKEELLAEAEKGE